jgi:tetratricopeptide (TPR) repeat protein
MRGRPRSGAPDRARRAASVRASLVCALVAAAAGCRGPEGPDAVELAERATSSGDWERAAELWYAVHRSEPEKTERSYHETARALFESGDAESACALLERGLEEMPRSALLLELHGDLLERSGFDRSAELAYARLVEVDGTSVPGLVALGRVRLALGLERAARPPLERALELEPDRAETHVHLALVHAGLGEDLAAYTHYARAFELGAGDDSLLVAAASLAMGEAVAAANPGAHRAAVLWMDVVVERQPQNTPAHFLRAVHLEALGELERARDAYLRAAETDPGCIQALTRLTRLYARLGDEALAEHMLQRVLALESDPARAAELERLVRGADDGP